MSTTYISALLGAVIILTPLISAVGQDASAAVFNNASWLLEKGIEQYEAGNYEGAAAMFDGVLAIDRYNSEAQAYKKRASRQISKKEIIKQGATRAQADADIKSAWNRKPKMFGAVAVTEDDREPTSEQLAIEHMAARLKAVTVPSLDFSDAHVEDVLLFLAAAGRRFSERGEDIDIALLGMDRVAANNTVSISFADMNLYDALQLVVEMTSLRYDIGPHVVSIMPANYVPLSQMIPQAYSISPEVGRDMESAGRDDSGAADLFGGTFSDEPITDPVDVKEFFPVVDFPEGSSAVYQPRFNKLLVKNTAQNLKLVEEVLNGLEEEALKQRSQQVEIETKFVEFSEGALEELGFDWTVYGSGSVAGMELNDDSFTFQKASGYANRRNAPPADQTYYFNPVTGQQVVFNPNTDDRPGQNFFGAYQRDNTTVFDPVITGILSTMGGNPAAMVINNGDVDLRIAAMEQQGTADLLSAPRITVKSGREALIRVAETHRYPQDWSVETGQRTAPIAKPQDWEDFDLGVSLKVTPVVDSVSGTIDLDIFPQVLEFKGEDRYQVAVNSYDAGANNQASPGSGGSGELIFARMAFFDRRSAQTQVTVSPGSTVVIGGLIDEQREDFRDQVPFLGDVPFLGRLFRTEGSRIAKKNLTIFLKANQLDSKGMTRAERELARETAAN